MIEIKDYNDFEAIETDIITNIFCAQLGYIDRDGIKLRIEKRYNVLIAPILSSVGRFIGSSGSNATPLRKVTRVVRLEGQYKFGYKYPMNQIEHFETIEL